MGKRYKSLIALILSAALFLGVFGALLHPAEASALDPLVSQAWVSQRIDEALTPLKNQLAALEGRILALREKQGVDIQLFIGKTTAMVNGREVVLDAAARIEGAGYTLVPIRFVAESLGVQVDWLAESRQIHFYDKDTDILMTVGSTDAWVNGQPYTLGYPPIIDNTYSQGRTLVHVRFVGEAFGCTLDWAPKTGGTTTVYIRR